MNFRLMLVDDDGNLVERWSVEHDFGDLSKPLPQQELVRAVREAIERAERGQS